MKRTWTIIGVSDVAGSFKWYQSLFGQPETPPGHDDFGQILDTDGTVLLCLHQWGAHEHPSLMSPDQAPPGNGLLLFFRVDDFDMALKRARALVTRFAVRFAASVARKRGFAGRATFIVADAAATSLREASYWRLLASASSGVTSLPTGTT